ncbi:hypothetical protein K435DRAFT_703072, partial [Dendrothele bispora CBS 962.96]
MGYTNAVQEFQRCVEHALETVREFARAFVDDNGCKGGRSRYNEEVEDGYKEARKFFIEYLRNLDLLLGALINAGVTASGIKAILAAIRLKIVGSIVSLEGWAISNGIVQKVLDWPLPESVTEVRGFLGTAG